MNYKTKTVLIASLLGLFGGLFSVSAHAVKIGDEISALSLKDQNGNEHTLDDQVQRIYAYNDRKSGAVVETAMKGLQQANLDAQHAIIITEISAAPGFVKRIIASGLKDRGYDTWIDDKGQSRRELPYRDNQVSVIDVQNRKITAIAYENDADTLAQIIKTAAEAAAPAATPAATTPPDAAPNTAPATD